MAFYSYKNVAHAWPHDMIERWEAAEGREFDDDYNYSGDGWLVASMWIDELIEASAKRDAEIAQLRADVARVTAERDARLDMSPAMLGAVLEAYENGEDEVEHSDGCAVCAALSVVREFVARGANGGV